MLRETYRASWTRGVFVQTFAPGMAGMALGKKRLETSEMGWGVAYQEATGFGERSTSTRHILQLPATASLGGWLSKEGYKKQDKRPVMIAESWNWRTGSFTGLDEG